MCNMLPLGHPAGGGTQILGSVDLQQFHYKSPKQRTSADILFQVSVREKNEISANIEKITGK